MKRSKKLLIGVSIFFIACSIVFSGVVISRRDKQSDTVVNEAQIEAPEQPVDFEYTELQGRYLFNGTIVLARAVERYALTNGERDYEQPFSQMDTFDPERYDAMATDFECPITDNVVPYEDQINFLVFNCRPEFLPAMTKYFSLFNLANNHTGDQGGAVGLESTRRYITEAGAQHFGQFDPTVTEDICEVIGLPIKATKKDGSVELIEFPIAFCSWHYFNYNRGPTEQELEPAREFAKYMPVFGFVEMGAEYQATASDDQRVIAKQIIDAGAEFVFANNPHWVQDSEVYNGKLIVYSLGNFIFDQLDDETNRGVSIDTELSIPYDSLTDAWQKLATTCKPAEYKDTCLQQAKDQNLQKIAFSLKYEPIANLNGVRQVTRRADAATQAAVEERLHWADTLSKLGQSSSTE